MTKQKYNLEDLLIQIREKGYRSIEEVEYLTNNGFIGVSLGKNILRAETVPLYLLSVINYELR